jgi:DNA-binding NtrC family response regulator
MVSTAPQNRLTVLLANEQEEWHQTVRRLLEPQGVRTLSAHSGREALSLMESTPIHLAVLDYRMPQIGGLQVVKLMRDLPTAPPAILLADHLTTHLLHEALGMHVFSVLAKPVDYHLLLETMARVMRRYHNSQWPQAPGTS